MKRYTLLLTAGLLSGLTFVVPASVVQAQEGTCTDDPPIVVSSPKSGATVGRNFTFTGSGPANAAFGIQIRGASGTQSLFLTYFPPEQRAKVDGPAVEGNNFATINASGQYSVPVDLNGQRVAQDAEAAQEGTDGMRALQAGTYSFELVPGIGQSACPSKTLSLTISDQNQTTTATSVATVKPSATAIASSAPAQVDSDSSEPAPWVVFLLGMLVGAGLLGAAEASAKRFHKKGK